MHVCSTNCRFKPLLQFRFFDIFSEELCEFFFGGGRGGGLTTQGNNLKSPILCWRHFSKLFLAFLQNVLSYEVSMSNMLRHTCTRN